MGVLIGALIRLVISALSLLLVGTLIMIVPAFKIKEISGK